MMKKITGKILVLASATLLGCGGPGGGGGGGALAAISPLRYMAEYHASIPNETVAKILPKLGGDEKLIISIYEAFYGMMQYKGCQADDTLTIATTADAVHTCAENRAGWEQTRQLLIQMYNRTDVDEFEYAKDEAAKIVIAFKCESGEIDAGSCSLYRQIQASWTVQQNEIFKTIVDSMDPSAECTSDGQVLDGGYVCHAN